MSPVVWTSGALAFALLLAGCASSLSSLPTQLGGLPAGTPERPATPAAYPAVHDMPPPRSTAVLTEEQQRAVEAELVAARDRQSKQTTPGKDQQSN